MTRFPTLSLVAMFLLSAAHPGFAQGLDGGFSGSIGGVDVSLDASGSVSVGEGSVAGDGSVDASVGGQSASVEGSGGASLDGSGVSASGRVSARAGGVAFSSQRAVSRAGIATRLIAITTSRRASLEETRLVTREFGEAGDYCNSVRLAYRVDCLAARYDQIAKRLPERGEYGRVRQVLERAVEDLEAVVALNASAAGRLAASKQSRALRAVSAARVARAQRAAESIIAEAQTLLLRSSESSRRRHISFERISAAMGANRRLLRAA